MTVYRKWQGGREPLWKDTIHAFHRRSCHVSKGELGITPWTSPSMFTGKPLYKEIFFEFQGAFGQKLGPCLLKFLFGFGFNDLVLKKSFQLQKVSIIRFNSSVEYQKNMHANISWIKMRIFKLILFYWEKCNMGVRVWTLFVSSCSCSVYVSPHFTCMNLRVIIEYQLDENSIYDRLW